MLNETRYGRLLINSEIYPFVEREFLSVEAIRIIRIWQMQIRGQEQKKLIGAIGKSPGREKTELYHGKIEGIRDNSEKRAGLTRTQYK